MPLREDLLTPIPGDNPSGANLRYDPVTDKVKEARREDIDAPQGAWKSTLKVADYALVIKLAGEAVATRSKDLQLAAWLVDAHVRREGFAILPPALVFLRELLEKFWDTLYPEVEDGDTEVRGAPLDWLGSKLDEPLRALPITSNGLSWVRYKESRTVGYESDATTDEKRRLRKQYIEEQKLTAEEFDQAVNDTPKAFYERLQQFLNDSLAALQTLNEFCDERFGDYAPSFVKLRSGIEEIEQLARVFITRKGGPTQAAKPVQAAPVLEVPAEAPAPAAPAAPATAAAPAPALAPQPAQPRGSGGLEPSDLEDAARRLAAIARFLRQKDKYDISPYLILRGHRWGEIRYNGPEIDTSMLAAPPAELRSRLKQAALAEDWDEVLDATETAMELPCGRAWLDIQRYAVKALEAKGEYFAFVAGAVRTALRGLLEELPGLLDMTLVDDTPAANPETVAWIRSDVLAGPVAAVSAAARERASDFEQEPGVELARPAEPAVALDSVPPQLAGDEPAGVVEPDVFDEAMRAAGEGRQTEALQLIARKLAAERSGRGRFKRKTQLAHLLMAGSRAQVAFPILEQLASEIEIRNLEEWEDGEALAYPLSLLLRCLAALGDDADKRKQVYARICRLDPVLALSCADE